MASKKRRVALLGAFEIQSEDDAPTRDGLILGSRREALGFVIETSRESIEHIVSLIAPPRPGLPTRLTASLGELMESLGCELLRIELEPVTAEEPEPKEGYGSYVQGWLLFRHEARRARKLALTATEAIQLALRQGLPMLADTELLRLDVTQLLEDMDQIQSARARDARKFHSFVSRVTATDFQRFYESLRGKRGDEPEDGEPG